MTFASAPDYETKDTYSVIANVSDDSFTARKAIQISINNLNDNTPAITSGSSFSADENQTAIGTVTATDADNDTITYSVSGSELSIDSSSGVISFASAPDYETKPSYSATVTASDGANATTQDITVAINDLNDEVPIFTSSPSFSADENQTAIGTVTATDADANTTLAYSLGGTDAASLTINSASGVLAFASAPDYETKSSYSMTITATDGTNLATQNISVSVNNLNDNTPAITSGSSFSADENQTAIGTVTATDADNDNITYSVSGSELSIDSSSGVLTFVSTPNFETKSSYSATVTASDGTNSAQSALTITVKDVNDVPTLEQYDCQNSEATVETCQIGDNVQDEDGDSISYSISGTDANLLSVSSSGVVSFNNWPDYESSNASADGDHDYEFLFHYTDGNSDPITQTTRWSIYNANDNHATLDTTTFNINEESCTVVSEGFITSSDLDGTIANQTLQYGIGSGGDSNLFTLDDFNGDGLKGELNFTDCDNKANYEDGDTQYQLSIRVFDGDLGWDSGTTVTLNVQDINDRPEWTITDSRWNLTLPENQQNVSQLTNATDEDGDTLVYSIVGGDNADDFSVNSATGQISMNSVPDREAYGNPNFDLDLQVTDGELSRIQEIITITITDVNEAPSITSSTTYSVDENQDSAGTLTSTDLDSCATTCSGHVFSISDGDSDEFNLNSSSGELTFKTTPDYETKSSYTFSATVTDSGGLSDTETITININDVNDNLPTITSGAAFTANENQFEVGTPNVQDVDVVATDADTDTLTYSMTSDTWINPENSIVTKIQIGTSNGRLYFTAKPDYEAKSSYSGTVTVSDGTNSVTQDITVTINNLNDNTPAITSASSFSADENQTSIGTVTATDADGDTITYTVSGSEINIDSSSGVLTFVSAPDFETKSSYSATVTATDGTNSVTQDITVSINDLNDRGPVFNSSETFTVEENQTAIGTVAAEDPDGDEVTYAISGTDININSVSGVISFASAPDFESKSSYSATITATDGTNPTTQDITVNITNINEAPSVTSSNTFTVEENVTAIGAVTASDPEGDAITYSIEVLYPSSDSPAITINGSTGAIAFVEAIDFDTSGDEYYTKVTVTDGVLSSTSEMWVYVTNTNDEVPLITSASEYTSDENQTSIGLVSATDADTGASYNNIVFSLSGDDASSFSINTSCGYVGNSSSQCNGTLAFKNAPDYETKSVYNFTVTASDGTNSSSKNITVNIADVNETPIITSSSSFTADENQTAIGTVTTTDPEDESIVYSISGSEININSSTGVLTFASAPDYENKTSYSATITASDGSFAPTQNITVSVTNLNDNSPVISSANSFSVVEGNTAIGSVSASDADGDSVSYSISGEDQSLISINETSGALTLNRVPNFENPGDTGSVDGDHDFSITVTASDGSNATTQNIAVEVKNDISVTVSFNTGGSGYVNVFDTAKSCISGSCTYRIFNGGVTRDIIDWVISSKTSRAKYDPRVKNYWGNIHDFSTSTFPDWRMGITDIGAAAVDTGAFVSNWGNNNRSAGDNVHIYRYIIGGKGGVSVEETKASTWSSSTASYSRSNVDIDAMVSNPENAIGEYVEISEDGNTIAFSNAPDGQGNMKIEIFRSSDGEISNFSSIGPLQGSHWTFGQAGFLLSNDGNRIAVLWDYSGSGAAAISVYEYSSGSWSKVGNDITGFTYPSSTENAYKNMAINYDGKMVGFVENQTGKVYIFKETSGTWSQLVTPFNNNGTDTRSGATSFDFNSYGNIIAVVEDNCFDLQVFDDSDSFDRLTRYCLGVDIAIGDANTTISDLILTDTRSILNVAKDVDSSEYSQVHLKTSDDLHYVFNLIWNNP